MASSTQQAGFRKGRGCEDQVTRLTQVIQDGFNRKKTHRSVLVLLDFSKAYDTVWKEKLLINMLEQGIPIGLLKWIKAFLENRQAKVKFNGEYSKSKTMRQGLPQGSMLSPLIFLFYINNLARSLPPTTTNSLFADDISILATHHNKEVAQKLAQQSVDIVSKWAKEWKLQLNADKSEASLFTTDTKEADWSTSIEVEGKTIRHEEHPRLLGVFLDRSLHFGAHVDRVIEKMASKQKILYAVANTKWGWKKEYLTRIYNSIINSIATYAGFTWLPSASKTHILKLKRAQNKALRLVTGHFQATPVEALRLECGLISLETTIQRAIAKSAEKAVRLPEDHPRRIALQNDVRNRLKNDQLENEGKTNAKTTTSRTIKQSTSNILSTRTVDGVPVSSSIPPAGGGHQPTGPRDNKEERCSEAYQGDRKPNCDIYRWLRNGWHKDRRSSHGCNRRGPCRT